MKNLIVYIILFFGANILTAQELLTLETAIQTSLENNYNILIARNNSSIATNSNNKGNAGFLPRLNTRGDYTYNISNSQLEFFSGDQQKRTGASNNSARLGADLTWTAFDGFKMYATRDRLDQEEKRSKSLIEKEMHDLVTQIHSAYTIIVRLEQQKIILEESIDLDLTTKKLAEDLMRLGKGTELEILQTTNRLNADSSSYLNVLDQVIQSQITLNRLMNVEPGFRYHVSTDWDPILLPEVNTLTSMAIAQNYEMQILNYDEQIALLQIKEARAALYPTIDLNLGYDFNYSKSEAGFLLSNRTLGPNFGISFNYDIFQGRSLKKEIQNSELVQENIQLTKKNIEAEIKSEIALLYQEYLALIDLYGLESRNVETAQKNVDLASELYRLGRASDLAVREAIFSLQQVKDRQSDVQYRQKVTEIQLKSLAGIPMYEVGN